MSCSPAQRNKVRDQACAYCRQDGPCDPAHLASKAQGGCDHPDCVVPLCRTHHRLFDTRALDLLPALEPFWRTELAHAVEHLGLLGTVRRVTNSR